MNTKIRPIKTARERGECLTVVTLVPVTNNSASFRLLLRNNGDRPAWNFWPGRELNDCLQVAFLADLLFTTGVPYITPGTRKFQSLQSGTNIWTRRRSKLHRSSRRSARAMSRPRSSCCPWSMKDCAGWPRSKCLEKRRPEHFNQSLGAGGLAANRRRAKPALEFAQSFFMTSAEAMRRILVD